MSKRMNEYFKHNITLNTSSATFYFDILNTSSRTLTLSEVLNYMLDKKLPVTGINWMGNYDYKYIKVTSVSGSSCKCDAGYFSASKYNSTSGLSLTFTSCTDTIEKI